MALKPLLPRNDTPEEQARYEADMKDFKERPMNWGAGPDPFFPADSAPEPASNVVPPPSASLWEYMVEAELEKLSKNALDWYARNMPKGFDGDEMTRKEILKAVFDLYPPKEDPQ